MKSEQVNVRLVAVGDQNVGQNSLYVSYLKDKISENYIPKTFENFVTQFKVDESTISLTLYNIHGKQAYKRIRTLAYSQTDVFLIVFSVTEPDTLKNAIQNWYPEVCQDELANIPKILVGNKIDIRDANNNNHLKRQDVEQQIQGYNLQYVECSAETKEGMSELIDLVKIQIKGKIDNSPQQIVKNEANKKDVHCIIS